MPYIGAGIQRFNTADGLTVNGDADFPDNAKAIFGTGSDLELSHNGTNSIIEGKTGDLILRTAGTESIFLQDAGGNNLAQFNDNSDVKLYHNANEKFATTSVGIGVDQIFGLGDTDTGFALGANGANILQVYTGNAERARFTNDGLDFRNSSGTHYVLFKDGDGVHFGASSGSNATSTVLDDYEEGTFTPEIRIGGSVSGITNNSQVGQYTKIGRMVTLTGRVSISNKGSNTGAMTIAGMPFASQNTSNLESFGVVELQNMSTGTDNLGSLTNNNVYCRISPNVLTIEMRRTMHDANDITNVQMTDTTVVGFTITYFT